jgi:hypothetical protein
METKVVKTIRRRNYFSWRCKCHRGFCHLRNRLCLLSVLGIRSCLLSRISNSFAWLLSALRGTLCCSQPGALSGSQVPSTSRKCSAILSLITNTDFSLSYRALYLKLQTSVHPFWPSYSPGRAFLLTFQPLSFLSWTVVWIGYRHRKPFNDIARC